jgi:beta-N-acetylhexosaminidase
MAAMQAMERAVQDGRITQERLEQSLSRVARLKARYLHPYKPVTISDARLVVGCRSHKVLLDSWRKAYARIPSTKSSENLQSTAALESPVAHI